MFTVDFSFLRCFSILPLKSIALLIIFLQAALLTLTATKHIYVKRCIVAE